MSNCILINIRIFKNIFSYIFKNLKYQVIIDKNALYII